MTKTERKTLKVTLVQLIERRIRDKDWLYWPPGPMTGQVFDRKACEADVAKMIDTVIPFEPSDPE